MEEIINEITEEEVFKPVVVDEPIQYNKIYARTNDKGDVVHIFSETFETPKESDICIDETNIDRHGAQKYPAVDENGYYNYKIVNGKMVARDKSIDIERKANIEKIYELKGLLQSTDYQALKFSDGALTEEEYAPIRAQRQAWRDEINALEILL